MKQLRTRVFGANVVRHAVIVIVLGAVVGFGVHLFVETSSVFEVRSEQDIQIVAREKFPGASWTTRTPAQVGLDQIKLNEFRDSIQALGSSDGFVVKDGYQIYTWGQVNNRVRWASATKPVISTHLLFAVAENKLGSVNDLIRPHVGAEFGQDLIPKDRTMSFRHLANMVSGYSLPEDPGTAWGYNDHAINLYARLLYNDVFNQTPTTVLRDANRLGVVQFQDNPKYIDDWWLAMSIRDFARICWFWLNKGNWDGTQVLPQTLFDNYMKPDVPGWLPRTVGGKNDYLNAYILGGGTNQTALGPRIYGFNWWFNPGRQTWPDVPSDAFQANGNWNKRVATVIPSLDMVAVWQINSKKYWGEDRKSFNIKMNAHIKLLVESVGTSTGEGTVTGELKK